MTSSHRLPCTQVMVEEERHGERSLVGCFSIGELLAAETGCSVFTLLGPLVCSCGLASRLLFYLKIRKDSYSPCAPIDDTDEAPVVIGPATV